MPFVITPEVVLTTAIVAFVLALAALVFLLLIGGLIYALIKRMDTSPIATATAEEKRNESSAKKVRSDEAKPKTNVIPFPDGRKKPQPVVDEDGPTVAAPPSMAPPVKRRVKEDDAPARVMERSAPGLPVMTGGKKYPDVPSPPYQEAGRRVSGPTMVPLGAEDETPKAADPRRK